MFNICDLPNIFAKAATKETFKPTKENQNIEKNLCLIHKLFGLSNYWSNQMENLIAAVKIFLLI